MDRSGTRAAPIARHAVLVMAALAICAITAALARDRTDTQAPQPYGRALKSVAGKALSQRYTNVIRDIGVRRAGTAEMLAYVVEEGGRLTGEQLLVPGAGEIMAGFIRRFGRRDATRVARTAIEVAACHQRDDLVTD